MKEKILKFFREDRSYEGAIKLYNEIGNNLSVKKQINLQPEKIMKGILFDQFRILAGITPDDFMIIQATPISTPPPPVDEKKGDNNIILKKPKAAAKPANKKQGKTGSGKKQAPKPKENPAKK